MSATRYRSPMYRRCTCSRSPSGADNLRRCPGRVPGMTEQPPATGDADYVAFVVAAWQRHQRLARLLTGDPSSADDLLQDALVKVYLRWRRLSRAGDPHGYLRRIMVNASTSRWRRGRREYLVDAPPDRPVSIGTGDHDDLRQALMSLPARQRAVVVLRYYEDLT